LDPPQYVEMDVSRAVISLAYKQGAAETRIRKIDPTISLVLDQAPYVPDERSDRASPVTSLCESLFPLYALNGFLHFRCP